MRNKKIIRMALALFVSIMLITAISFAERKVKNNTIQEVNIAIGSTSQGQFITDVDILDRLNAFYAPGLLGSFALDLDILTLDSLVESSPFVRNASVFTNLEGKVYVDIEQEVPLLRIINNRNSSYYINMQGHKMPLSAHRTAKVTVANGNIKEELFPTDSFTSKTLKDLFTIAQFLDKNKFFKALTAQLFVATNGDIVLITKQEERHDIILGNAEDLENKFGNLFQFYTKVLSVKGWDAYRTINLKYKNQIIAKK